MIRETPIGKSTIEKDQLTSIDWLTLQQIYDFLKPFRDEILVLEGHWTQGSLHEIYTLLESLRRHIVYSQNHSQSEVLSGTLKLAAQKLEKYYSIDELSPIICASIVLHPDMDNFFEDTESVWGERPSWGFKAKDLVKTLWETSYKRLQLHSVPTITPESPKRTQDPNSFIFKRVRTFKKPQLNPESIEDELSRYFNWVAENGHEIGLPIPW